MRKRPKICLFGNFGKGNLGNECTLQAIIHNVRKYLSDADIGCACTGPREISERYDISVFPIFEYHEKRNDYKEYPRRNNPLIKLVRKILGRILVEIRAWTRAFNELKETDMLIMCGTGMLAEHGMRPFGFPFAIFRWSFVAKIRQCKLLYLSVGAESIHLRMSRLFIKRGLRLADYRSYRDSYSKQYVMKSTGFQVNSDPIYPDLAFSLPSAIMPDCENRDTHRPIIGVGIYDYYGPSGKLQDGKAIYQNYINKMGTLVTWLIEHNYTVRILIGDVLYDACVKQDLKKAIEQRGLIDSRGDLIVEAISCVEQLLAQISTIDMVVATRFHNILLALMLNKPAISISYNEKNDYLMGEMGLAKYCQHIAQLDIGRLIEQFVDLEKSSEKLRPYMKLKTKEYKKVLNNQYRYIFNNLLIK